MYINQDKLNHLIDIYSEIRIDKKFGFYRMKKSIKLMIPRENKSSFHLDNGWKVVEEFRLKYVDENGIKMKSFSKPYIYIDEINAYVNSLEFNIKISETKNHLSYLALTLFSVSLLMILSFSWANNPKELLPLIFLLLFTVSFFQNKLHLELRLKIYREIIHLLKHIEMSANQIA